MDITALAISRYATQDYGPLRCVGRFNNAINFLSPNDRLLTLHREGRGLSPMGWEIGDDDFDEIFDSLPAAQHCQLSPAGIELEDIAIYRQGRWIAWLTSRIAWKFASYSSTLPPGCWGRK